jgi:hypothetical protein
MNDSFGLGDPITGRRRPADVAPLVVIAVAVAVAATLGGAALLVMKRGGEVAAQANERTIGAIDRANDIQAQASLQTAVRAALTVQAETGSIGGATPEALAGIDPSITVTSAASTGPTIVSVSVGGETWGAAAMSASGSCFWLRLDATGVISYGSGAACSGAAALGASQPSW